MSDCVQKNLQAQCTFIAGNSTTLALQDAMAGVVGLQFS